MDTATRTTTPTGPGLRLVDLTIVAAATTCFAVHLVLLVATGTAMLTMLVAMLVLSGLCVACAWRARGTHGRGDHAVAAGLAVTMIVVHLLLMSSGGHDATTMDQLATGHGGHTVGHAAMGHAAGSGTSTGGLLPAVAVGALMNTGLGLAALQVVLATGAALRPAHRARRTFA